MRAALGVRAKADCFGITRIMCPSGATCLQRVIMSSNVTCLTTHLVLNNKHSLHYCFVCRDFLVCHWFNLNKQRHILCVIRFPFCCFIKPNNRITYFIYVLYVEHFGLHLARHKQTMT